MRISDWSSDVCSSDLPCCLCPASVRYGPVTVPWAQVMPKARRGDVSQRVRLIMEHHFGETNCPAGEKYHKRVGPRCWFIWKYDAPDAIRSFGEINPARTRSEERRVGKECVSTCRSRWSPYH